MEKLLQKCYLWTPEQLTTDILATYQKQHFCIINFLYYAQIHAQQLFEEQSSHPKKWEKPNETKQRKQYAEILEKGDYLLPDGIALQLLYRYLTTFWFIQSTTSNLPNLNGTDFTPFFLKETAKKIWKENIGVLCYGTKPEILPKAYKFIEKMGIEVIYAQDGYTPFDRWKAEKAIITANKSTLILLQGRSTPTIPLQELRTQENYEKIKQHQLIVMNVGGLFDWRGGGQKRAPLRIRKIKLERAWRLCSDPKRNFKKCLNTLYGPLFVIKITRKRLFNKQK